jgi:hypothetical membrane protein
MTIPKIGLFCGVLAPILWAVSIVACGTMRPGYNHFTQYISELGERGCSTEVLMRYGGFIPAGLMYVGFAVSLLVMFGESWSGVIAAVFVGVSGLARIGAGTFPCDVGCGEPIISLSQRLHSLFASVAFVTIILAAILWGIVFRRYRGLGELTNYSVGSGVLGLMFLMLMVWNAEPGSARGLLERLASGTLSLWVFIFAARLYRIDPHLFGAYSQG